MLYVKPTVRPYSLVIVAAVVNAAEEAVIDEPMVITSGNDSQHRAGSKHYINEALDFRTKHLTATQKARLVAGVERRLGRSYQVFIEDPGLPNEHLHVEYDPRTPHVEDDGA